MLTKARFRLHYKNLRILQMFRFQSWAKIQHPPIWFTGNHHHQRRQNLRRPKGWIMDSRKKMSFDSNWHWTDEKHTDFLNSMEAAFVRTMFENNCHISRLDRYIPDTSESTQDLGKERRRRYSTSELSGRKKDKKTRLFSSQSDISSQDQVVPQVKNERDDKDKNET